MQKPFQLVVTEICIFLIPFSLLLISPWLFFPYITLKALTFRILVQVAGFFYLWLILKRPEYRPKKSILSWAVLAFWLTSALTTLISTSRYFSFFGNAERMDGLFSYSHWFLLFFIFLGLALKDRRIIRNFTIALFVVSILEFLIAVLQKLSLAGLVSQSLEVGFGVQRVPGTFGNPAYLGTFGILIFALSAFFFFDKSFGLKKLAALNAVLGIADIFLSATRSALAGLAVFVFIFFVFLALQKQNQKARKLSQILVAVFIVLIAVFWLVRDQAWFSKIPAVGRFANVLKGGDTSVIRLIVWQSFLRSFWDRPVLGWGLEQSVEAFSAHFNPKLTGYEDSWFDRPHNKFLEVLVTQGVVGFAAYIFLLVAAGVLIVKAYKENKVNFLSGASLLGFLFGYSVNNFFLFDMQVSYTVFFGFLVSAAFLYLNSQKSETALQVRLTPVKWLLLLLGAALLIFILIFDYHNFESLYYISKSNYDALANNGQAVFNDWQKAWSSSVAFHEEVAQNFSGVIPYIAGNSNLGQQAMNTGLTWLNTAIENNPLNSRTYLFLLQALSYVSPQSPGLAKIQQKLDVAASQALTLAPQFPEMDVQLAINYLVVGDYAKAESYIKQTLALTSAIPRAYFVYAFIAKDENNWSLASQMAQQAIEKGYPWSSSQGQINIFALIFQKAGNQTELNFMANYLKQTNSQYKLP